MSLQMGKTRFFFLRVAHFLLSCFGPVGLPQTDFAAHLRTKLLLNTFFSGKAFGEIFLAGGEAPSKMR